MDISVLFMLAAHIMAHGSAEAARHDGFTLRSAHCIPMTTAMQTHPTTPKIFFGFNLDPGFAFAVNSNADVDHYHHLVRENAMQGGFTEGVFVIMDLVLRHAPKGTVVDVGSNFGTTSIFAAKLGHRVTAIEGNNETAGFFKFNVLLNCLQHRIHLVESLVSDKAEHVAFLGKDRAGGDLSGGAFAQKSDGRTTAGARPAQPLDTLLAEMKHRPLLMKVDIEGFEPHAFAGAQRTLQAMPPYYVVWECSLLSLSSFDVLHKHDYTFYYLGSMDLQHLSNETKAQWLAWTQRRIDVDNLQSSIEKWHSADGRPGAFDVVAVHKDQVAGCPASVSCNV